MNWRERVMDSMEFINIARAELSWRYKRDYGVQLDPQSIYLVWMAKTLQNNKALFSTPISGDGVYWEVTFNGDKSEMYIDTYAKRRNECVQLHSKAPVTTFEPNEIQDNC